MNGRAYYNEIDPDAVAVLRQCIADGTIAPGDVDTRSIRDVQPSDLASYTQCHFFAGGGLWSVSARLAGWPDGRRLWTGSCPCQPFSAAGKRAGTDDPRHLWPDFLRLIDGARERGFGPPVVMGEQVSGAPGYAWFDGIRADLAAKEYLARTVDIPACAVDAPHQRNRLYWIAVADAEGQRRGREQPERGSQGRTAVGRVDAAGELVDASSLGRGEGRPEYELWGGRPASAGADAQGVTLGDAFGSGLERLAGDGDGGSGGAQSDRPVAAADGCGDSGPVGHGERNELARERLPAVERQGLPDAHRPNGPAAAAGRNGSFWSDAEWIVCHDGKARRAKPGIRLLVDGLPGRVGLWRVAGNSIAVPLATEVLKAFLEAERGIAA